MGGLTLNAQSAMIDWLRKNEPRGDFLGKDDNHEQIWYGGTPDVKNDLSIVASTGLLYIIRGIEVIIEIRTGESVPTIATDNITIYYPETESRSAPAQASLVIDTTNRGLDALLSQCRRDTLKLVDFTSESGVKYILGMIDLNHVILDSSLSQTQKQLLLQAGATLDLGGTGRIIFRALGWKILRSDY